MLGSILLTILMGVLDYWTGFEISFAFFYLLPVSLAAWVGGKKMGFTVSVSSSLVWLYANTLAGELHSNPLVPYWNALTRLGFFLVVSILLAELRQLLEHERKLARTDILTGAYNRRVFYEVLSFELIRSQRYGRPFTVLYLDLDDFKKINDRLGHQTGDNLLKIVSDILIQGTRTADVFCRLGGDEFAMLMPETDQEAAQMIIPRLQAALSEAMLAQNWPVTFSIGSLTCISPTVTADQLVAMADQLMYQVKQSTKNGIRYAVFTN